MPDRPAGDGNLRAQPGTTKQCPNCKELIRKWAHKCPHCGSIQPTPRIVLVGLLVIFGIMGLVGIFGNKKEKLDDLVASYLGDSARFLLEARDKGRTQTITQAWVDNEVRRLKEKYHLSHEEFLAANELMGKIVEAMDKGGYDLEAHNELEKLLSR